jgi:hypothetical protein
MRDGATGDHTLINLEHVGLAIKRYPHHLVSIPEVHNLFSSNASISNKFQTIHGTFLGLLMLDEPFDRSLVDKMEDTSVGPSSSEIILKVHIFKDSGAEDGFNHGEALPWIHHRHFKPNQR